MAETPSEPSIASQPDRLPIALGWKTMLYAQESPPRTADVEHAFDCAKSPVIAILENRKHPDPVLLNVAVLLPLDVPTI